MNCNMIGGPFKGSPHFKRHTLCMKKIDTAIIRINMIAGNMKNGNTKCKTTVHPKEKIGYQTQGIK